MGADVPRVRLRISPPEDLNLLVRRRPGMWEEIAGFSEHGSMRQIARTDGGRALE